MKINNTFTVAISLHFYFPDMEIQDKRFTNLNLFQKLEHVDVYCKTYQAQKGISFNTRIVFNNTQFANVLNLVLGEIAQKNDELLAIGMEEEIAEFELFFEFEKQAILILSTEQLQNLRAIQPNRTGISFNSLVLNDSKEEYESAEYYQVYFQSSQISSFKSTIQELWLAEFSDKYESIVYWTTDGEDSLVLNIKEFLEVHKWNDILLDSIHFIKNHQCFFNKHQIKLTYSIYYCNVSGGEIGKELILQLLELGLDLCITKSNVLPY